MARRKYQFRDRAEAETEYRAESARSHRYIRGLMAILDPTKNINWTKGDKGQLDVGLFDLDAPSGAKVVTVSRLDRTGRVDVAVNDAAEWCSWWFSTSDDAMRMLACKVDEAIRSHRVTAVA